MAEPDSIAADVSLNDSFNCWADWWLPTTPDQRVPGIIRYSKSDGIRLDLEGRLQGLGPEQRDMLSGETVLGQTRTGQKITLQQSSETHVQQDFTSGNILRVTSASMFANKALVNVHLSAEDSRAFTEVAVEFWGLDQWIRKIFFEEIYEALDPERPDSKTECGWKYKPLEDLIVYIPAISGSLRVHHAIRREGPLFTTVHCEVTPILTIALQSAPTSAEELLGHIFTLQQLLALLTGKPAYPRFIRLKIAPELAENASSSSSHAGVFYQPLSSYSNIANDNLTDFIPYVGIEPHLSSICHAWFTRAANRAPARSIYFGNLYAPTQFIEYRLIGLMQALESHHRNTRGGEYLSKEQFRPINESLARLVSETVTEPGLAMALKGRIKYGYQYSLRKRLDQTIERLPAEIRNLVPWDSTTTNRLVTTRNYFTHYDPDDLPLVLQGGDLARAIRRLENLLRILLLIEAEIPVSEIVRLVSQSSSFSAIRDTRF